METKSEISGENYLGLMGLAEKQKKQLFEIIYLYRLWEEYLVKIKGLVFKRENLPWVGGMVLKVNSDIELACKLALLLLRASSEEQVEFFEDLNLQKLDKAVVEMRKLVSMIPNYDRASWWLKFVVLIRYGDWRKIFFGLAYVFLSIFIFGSVLYFFIATDFGRGLAWDFLDLYGIIVKFLMILMLIIAMIMIVAIVSFMYFEGRGKRVNKK